MEALSFGPNDDGDGGAAAAVSFRPALLELSGKELLELRDQIFLIPPPKADPKRALVPPEGAGPEPTSGEETANRPTTDGGVPSVRGGGVGGGDISKAKRESPLALGGGEKGPAPLLEGAPTPNGDGIAIAGVAAVGCVLTLTLPRGSSAPSEGSYSLSRLSGLLEDRVRPLIDDWESRGWSDSGGTKKRKKCLCRSKNGRNDDDWDDGVGVGNREDTDDENGNGKCGERATPLRSAALHLLCAAEDDVSLIADSVERLGRLGPTEREAAALASRGDLRLWAASRDERMGRPTLPRRLALASRLAAPLCCRLVMPVAKDAGGGGTAAAISKTTTDDTGAQFSSSSETSSDARGRKTVTLGDQEAMPRVDCCRSDGPDLPQAAQLSAGSAGVRKKVTSVVRLASHSLLDVLMSISALQPALLEAVIRRAVALEDAVFAAKFAAAATATTLKGGEGVPATDGDPPALWWDAALSLRDSLLRSADSFSPPPENYIDDSSPVLIRSLSSRPMPSSPAFADQEAILRLARLALDECCSSSASVASNVNDDGRRQFRRTRASAESLLRGLPRLLAGGEPDDLLRPPTPQAGGGGREGGGVGEWAGRRSDADGVSAGSGSRGFAPPQTHVDTSFRSELYRMERMSCPPSMRAERLSVRRERERLLSEHAKRKARDAANKVTGDGVEGAGRRRSGRRVRPPGR